MQLNAVLAALLDVQRPDLPSLPGNGSHQNYFQLSSITELDTLNQTQLCVVVKHLSKKLEELSSAQNLAKSKSVELGAALKTIKDLVSH